MLGSRTSHRRMRAPLALAAAALLSAGGTVATSFASDHQDTPEVELSPRMDINDVYAFPGSSADRIALVLTTSSPISPAQSAGASFDPDLLYQLKVDNDGDALEDLVFQITFEGVGANQQVRVRGPVAPNETGMRNSLVMSGPLVSGAVETTIGSPTGTQVFAGLRDDPFFIDLEQFFRIVPDRKPVSGELSQIPDTPTASSFRNPGIDYVRSFNALAIVIELPESALTAGGTPRLGIWGTISR